MNIFQKPNNERPGQYDFKYMQSLSEYGQNDTVKKCWENFIRGVDLQPGNEQKENLFKNISLLIDKDVFVTWLNTDFFEIAQNKMRTQVLDGIQSQFEKDKAAILEVERLQKEVKAWNTNAFEDPKDFENNFKALKALVEKFSKEKIFQVFRNNKQELTEIFKQKIKILFGRKYNTGNTNIENINEDFFNEFDKYKKIAKYANDFVKKSLKEAWVDLFVDDLLEKTKNAYKVFLEQNTETGKNIVEKIFVLAEEKNPALVKMLWVNLLNNVIDCIDLSIKSLSGSQKYLEPKEKQDKFYKLVTQISASFLRELYYTTLSSCRKQGMCENRINYDDRFDEDILVDTRIEQAKEWIDKQKPEENAVFSETFNVDAALFSSLGGSCFVKTIEDLFCSFHQNSIDQLSILYFDISKNMQKSEILKSFMKQFEEFFKSAKLGLRKISLKKEKTILNYNLGFRTHSADIYFEIGKQNILRVKLYGGQEKGRRWEAAVGYAKQFNKNTRASCGELNAVIELKIPKEIDNFEIYFNFINNTEILSYIFSGQGQKYDDKMIFKNPLKKWKEELKEDRSKTRYEEELREIIENK